MNIIIDEDSVRQGSNEKITGGIYFEVDNEYFPEKGWNDFPVIILCWWINNFLKTLKKYNTSFEFYFMDGPFLILGEVIKPEEYKISFIRRIGKKDEIIIISYVSQKEIQKELMKTCRKILRILEVTNISSKEVRSLKGLFTELKKVI